MHVGRTRRWTRDGDQHKRIYYEVFHANKNAYVDGIHLPTVDVYECLGLSDEFCKEIAKSHDLANLNVKQSPSCEAELKKTGHVRDKHSDLTGGDCQRLLAERCVLDEPIGDISETFTALRPMAVAACSMDRKLGPKRDARKCFVVFHKLYTLFSQAAELRLTIHSAGDHSAAHETLVRAYFDCMMDEVGSALVDNMKGGLTYMSWPMHYVAEHLSGDMAAWAAWTGGLPYGRSSNQVTEHMNKVIKRYLKRNTNSGVDSENIYHSKWRQVLLRLAAKRLRRAECVAARLRKKFPCRACLKRGIVLTHRNMHYRVNSSHCNPLDRVERKNHRTGHALPACGDSTSCTSSSVSSSSDSSEEEAPLGAL